MTLNEARLVMELRSCGYSWRALAEAYYEEHQIGYHGDQMSGSDLCMQAAETLGLERGYEAIDNWKRTSNKYYEDMKQETQPNKGGESERQTK